MGSVTEAIASAIRSPRRSEVYQFAGTAGAQIFAVPAGWLGMKIRFEAIGDDFWVQVAPDATIAINTTQVVTIGASPTYTLPAAGSATAEKIPSGTFKEFDIVAGIDLFVAFRGTRTTGFLTARQATSPL